MSASRSFPLRFQSLGIVLIIVSLALSGCVSLAEPDSDLPVAVASEPTPGEIVSETKPPQNGIAPLTEETPAIVIEPPIPLPTATPIPASVGVPLEQLALLKPGPGSLVRSPIQVEGFGGPSQNNRVQVRLYGEDGRLISQGYTFLYSYPGRPGQFFAQVPFDTPLVAETGWLEVRSFGDRYGLLRHLTKIQINLLSTGGDKIYPAIQGAEKITILSPREDSRVTGGTVELSGAAWIDAQVPLNIEMLDARGDVLAATSLTIEADGIGQLTTFNITLDYQIDYGQWARIGVYERHGDIPGVIHYSSVQVWLEP